MSNMLWIDTETSALGHNAALIEIAAIAYVDGERVGTFQSYIKPHPGATMDPKAFEINKIDPTKLNDFPEMIDVMNSFISFVDKFECVFSISGHNISFDKDKLYKFFCRNMGYGLYLSRFRPGGTCTMKLAKDVFKGKRNKPDGFSLEKLCKFFEIELINSHSALPDIEATIKLYESLLPKVPTIQNQEIAKLSYQEMKRKYMDMKYVSLNPEGDVFLTRECLLNDVIRRFVFTELDALYEQTGHDAISES